MPAADVPPVAPAKTHEADLGAAAAMTEKVTLLFTDIEGSTQLLRRLGDRYDDVLAEYRQLLRAVLSEHGGREVDTQGDSFFFTFPQAREAVAAATKAQLALARHPWANGERVPTRMALHTGAPRRSTEGYVGIDVVRAARLCAAAHGGQVLLSATTRTATSEELPDGVDIRDLGTHQLKDLPHPEPVFQLVIADLPVDFPPLHTLGSYPHNLPVLRDSLIGREHEVAKVRELLLRDDVGLLTLSGPGGVGKTRVALQVAAELLPRFPGGVFFVSLAPIKESSLVPSTIAAAMQVKETAGQSLVETLEAHLHHKKVLLVLDNFEQVVEAAPLLSKLLQAAAGLKVLLTSRATVQIREERLVDVPPLAVPPTQPLPPLDALSQYPAVRLFLRRSQAIDPDFAITPENAAAVASVCERLDGLPLAIELAAARSKVLPPRALLARLQHPLGLLRGAAPDLPPRQQTLRSTLAWSYQLLDPIEQTLFRRLAVFVGGCTLEAADAVCNAGGNLGIDLLDGIQSLIDKSLLRQREQANGEPRLMMLETIHAYARERLCSPDTDADRVSSEAETMRRCHAEYFAGLAERGAPGGADTAGEAWVQQLEAEHDNLRAALRWAREAEEALFMLHMCLVLQPFWTLRGYWREGRQWLDAALAVRGQVPSSLRAYALDGVVRIAVHQSDRSAQMLARAEESLTLYRSLRDEHGIASALKNIGYLTTGSDDARAERVLEESLTRFVALGDAVGIREVMLTLSALRLDVNTTRITVLLDEAIAHFRQHGDRQSLAAVLNILAEWLRDHEEYERAQAMAEESLKLYSSLDDAAHAAIVYHNLGETALLRGDDARAQTMCEESVALSRRTEATWYLPWPLIILAYAAHHQGDDSRARGCLRESLAIIRDLGHQTGTAFCLAALASVLAGAGKPEHAARLLGAAEVIIETLHERWLPVHQRERDRSIAIARASVDEVTWATAWADGRAMTPEQAIAFALDQTSVEE
jgi:predicted ATPase/class 3 adenylate cyclase